MTSADLTDLINATVTVRTATGTNSRRGTILAAEVKIPGWLTRRQQLIRSANGEQVMSSGTFSAAVEFADTLALGSQVTVPGEDPTTILRRDVSVGGSFIDGLDRVKAYLQ